MISMVQPLPVGNALRLFLEPPAGAVMWRILRKGSDTFVDQNDVSAVVAYQGNERVTIDSAFLTNQVMVFYRPFYTVDGVVWTAGPTASGTPDATYEEQTVDVMSFIRERLEAGLKVEVQRGNIMAPLGYVQVYTATPSLERDQQMPLVTVHLDNEDPDTRAIGEDIAGDFYDAIGDVWQESEGWLSSVRLTIIGWSLNSDERLELRKAIRRIVIANMPVFAEKGWVQPELSQQDIDAVNGEYPAHIYQVMSSFSCVAPVRVSGTVNSVRDVISQGVING